MHTGAASLLQELSALKGNYSGEAVARKLQLLQQLTPTVKDNAAFLRNYHEYLLFSLAYPENKFIYGTALQQLRELTTVVAARYQRNAVQLQRSLNGSGIYFTETVCTYSFSITRWLVENFGGDVCLHCSGANAATISRVFELMLPKAEYQQVTQENSSLLQRIQKLTGQKNKQHALQWLLQHMEQVAEPAIRDHLYDELQVFVSWQLRHPFFNRSFLRSQALQKIHFVQPAAPVIDYRIGLRKKLELPVSLSDAGKKQLLDAARAALALHYRETDPVSFGDCKNVTCFDMGQGISIALFTMQPQHRFSIESYIGYMAFVNGLPAAYGGGWLLGHRCKIGINIFPALRGGNSSLLFAAILRLYHQYYHANRFVVKPYQFGKNNPDGLRSGAFWFYYKLGFRPATTDLQQLALQEAAKKQQDKKYRSPLSILKQFTAAPLQLLLGKNTQPSFDGSAFSKAITRQIIKQFAGDRKLAKHFCSKQLKILLAASGMRLNSAETKLLLQQWPWMSLFTNKKNKTGNFTKKESRQFLQLLLNKFNPDERDYIIALQEHKKLWELLEEMVEAGSWKLEDGRREQEG